MTTDFRALCKALIDEWDAAAGDQDLLSFADAIDRARAALAQPEPQGPSDKELLELMPETMRDEFSYAANVCSDAMGGRVKPGIFRVALNTAALEYAHAVLARWGRPAIEPVPVSERPWEREGWCDAGGKCWMGDGGGGGFVPSWRLCKPSESCLAWSLPHHALPVPKQEADR